MKAADWPKVNINEYVIYPLEDEGPKKAKVLERDIRLYEPGTPSIWSYPYGLTDETGTVKVQYDSTEAIVNLADCIKWTQNNFLRLESAWKRYLDSKDLTEGYKEIFLELTRELREK